MRALQFPVELVAGVVRAIEPVALLETDDAEAGLGEAQPDDPAGRPGPDDQDVGRFGGHRAGTATAGAAVGAAAVVTEETDLFQDAGQERPLLVVQWQQRPADRGVLEDAQDPQALLEPDPVVPDRCREHDIRQPLDAAPERHRGFRVARLPGRDHVDLFAGHDRPEPDQRPGRTEQERLEDEVVVAGQQRDRPRQALEETGRVDEPAGIEGRLLHRDHAVHRGHRGQRVGLEVDTGQRRLELEQDERQPDIRDRLVIGDRHARVERLAEVGRDREDEQRIGAGGPEVTRLADRGFRRWTGQPGHDRQVRDLADDLQDANLLVVGQVRPLPRVDIDRQRDRTLPGDPADVPAERRFVDPAVPIHGQHGRGDQAIQVQRHGIAPSVRWSEVSVYYRTACRVLR